jgi:hypothetical protein
VNKTLRPVLDCITLIVGDLVLGRTPLPTLYWLTDKVVDLESRSVTT